MLAFAEVLTWFVTKRVTFSAVSEEMKGFEWESLVTGIIILLSGISINSKLVTTTASRNDALCIKPRAMKFGFAGCILTR